MARPRKNAKKTLRKRNKAQKNFDKLLRNKILSVIKLHREVKISDTISYNVVPINSYNTTGPVVPTIIDLNAAFTAITQGTGQGGRIGNRIQPKSVMLRMILRNFETTRDYPLVYKMVIGRSRFDLDVPNNNDFVNLFQDGNGVSAPTNALSEIYHPLNKDYWKIKKTKIFKLNPSSNAESNPVVNNTQIPLNGFGQYQVINLDLAKYFPKQMIYNDTGATPFNERLYMFFLVGEPYEASPSNVITSALVLNGTLTAYYYDD